ncbi:MAG TPA: energy transducer TonB [Terriglobales bacterium]|nr:energy transducer TonB [Terriglobales bacterium]
MAIMHYQALLFCPDDKTARVVTQVLSELEFQVERCNEPFATVKKLMAQHFDAIVVDCENEQNATLLFKSARNSASSSSSLSVAVVEGQDGVAKAFRIGANLVLTKPINIEQSKGTLRVARGLLRKAEATKPIPAAPDPAARLAESSTVQSSTATIPVQPPQAPVPVANASAFELEAEPDVKPDAAEATLLEYMPKVPVAPATPAPLSTAAKEFPWEPVSKSSAPLSVAGAAAAPAPAKEVADPEIVPIGAPAAPAPARIEPPVFSSLTSPEAYEPSSAGGAAKKFVFILIAAVLVIAGYFGWTKMHAGDNPVAVQKESVPSQPTVVVTPPARATPEQQPVASTPAQQTSEAPTQQPEEISLEPDAKPALAKPTPVVVKTPPASKEATQVKPAPIVIKNDFSAPKSEAAMLPPVPPSIPSAPDTSAVASIVNSPVHVPNPVRETQTLKVSQGVSQGMLIKRVQPVYPSSAKQMRLEGTVQLMASITKDGRISSVKQLSGDAILGRAAIDAVRQWKYKPYFLNGEPVEIQTQITVNFKLP